MPSVFELAQRPDVVDWIDQPWYDRGDAKWATTIAAGASKDYFVDTSRDKADNNNPDARGLPDGWAFALTGIGVAFDPICTIADAQKLSQQGIMEFRINTRILREGPLFLHPSGYGVSGHATTTVTNTSIQGAQNGPVGTAMVDSLSLPMMLTDEDRIEGKIRFEDAVTLGVTTYIYMILRGQLKRRV